MVAERIKAAVANNETTPEVITASIGVTTMTSTDAETSAQLLDRMTDQADRALFQAKTAGRDGVIHAQQLDVDSLL